jgi:hypothetical protein
VQAKWHIHVKGDRSAAQAKGFLLVLATIAQDFSQGSTSYGGVILISPISLVTGSNQVIRYCLSSTMIHIMRRKASSPMEWERFSIALGY